MSESDNQPINEEEEFQQDEHLRNKQKQFEQDSNQDQVYQTNQKTIQKDYNRERKNLSPTGTRSPNKYSTNSQFENYSPSKGVFDYYNDQNRRLENRLEQKEIEIGKVRGELAAVTRNFEIVQKENNQLKVSNSQKAKTIDEVQYENLNLNHELTDRRNEIEKNHQIILDLENRLNSREQDLDQEHQEKLFWQDKQKQTEHEKNTTIALLENQHQRTLQEFRFEAEQRERSLQGEIQKLEDRLRREQLSHQETLSQLKQTQLEKGQEELEKRRIIESLEIQKRLFEESNRKNAQENQLRETIHNDKIKNLTNLHSFEKEKLLKDISTLNSLINSKSHEAQLERLNNHKLSVNLNEKEKILRNESAEKEFYRQKYDDAERKRSVEQVVNQSNIQNLKQSFHQEIITKELEKDRLQKQLINKEVEVHQTRQSQIQTLSEKQQLEREKKRKEIEAEYHRLKAQEIERKKNLELSIKEELYQKEKQGLVRSYSAEKQLLVGQVHNLSTQVVQQSREANNWRANYLIEKEHERKLSAEKEILSRQVNNLNREVVHKAVEASQWRNNYIIEQQKERQLSAEKEILARQNNSLTHSVVLKANEAEQWKRNFIIEKEQERRLANEKALLSAQNNHLNQKYIQKTVEANAWQNSYYREVTSPVRIRRF